MKKDIILILFILIVCIFFLYKNKKAMNKKYRVIGTYQDVKSYEYTINKPYREDKNYIYIIDDDISIPIYTGIKWECVEYIRRFLIENYQLTFENVKNALDMISLTHFYSIIDDSKIPIYFIPYSLHNILSIRKHDIIIFSYKDTGHVALVTKPLNKRNRIEIVEQNWEKKWESKNYSRTINVYDPTIIGWLRF